MLKSILIIVLLGINSFAIQVVTDTINDWSQVSEIINQGIHQGYFSGCILSVLTTNKTLLKQAYGTTIPIYGLFAPIMKVDMLMDIGYLTQVIAINSVLMEMIDRGTIDTLDRVTKFLYEFNNNNKKNITIKNLLIHNSGLQFTYPISTQLNSTTLYSAINNLKLQYKSDEKFLFSEIGYVVLGQMISKIKNKTLNSCIFDVLVNAGLRNTTFVPKASLSKIVPSGFIPKIGVSWGTSSNSIARILASIGAGNAGMFSTIDNMITYMQIMLNRGKSSFSQVFSAKTVEQFTTKVNILGYKNTRALGWDTIPSKDPPCGTKFSSKSFGLADTSGSYIWTDFQKNVSIILMTNGNFPIGRNPQKWQGKLSDAIMTALGY